jgi:hypothetical protein
VGHFASAGFKRIPPSVAESAEDLKVLHDFFSTLPAVLMGMKSTNTSPHSTIANGTYIALFAIADRRLFSFDTETYAKAETCYFSVAIPKHPLRFAG